MPLFWVSDVGGSFEMPFSGSGYRSLHSQNKQEAREEGKQTEAVGIVDVGDLSTWLTGCLALWSKQ